MIRRELRTKDGQASWLLISQVEHARVSGLLAAKWTAADLSPYQCDRQPLSKATTDEILAAITHHDDGWARWEAMPRIDPAHGRPYSFMNELPLDESLSIWDGSVAAARQIGTLAGWMVAGHFSELLENGNHESESRAVAWLEQMRHRRAEWLGEWQRQSTDNSSHIAQRALRLLQACDFLSLWLCCECPVSKDQPITIVKPFQIDWPEHRVGPYRFEAKRQAAESSGSNDRSSKTGWRVDAVPWPFANYQLHLVASGRTVPVRRFENSRELVESCRPVELNWLIGR